MIIFALLIPFTMFLIGIIWTSSPPTTINSFYGYRTRMSMLSQETWDFAHKMTSKIWSLGGFIMLILSLISYLFFEDKAIGLIVITFAQVAIMLLTIIPVEIALKQNFDKFGNRKY